MLNSAKNKQTRENTDKMRSGTDDKLLRFARAEFGQTYWTKWSLVSVMFPKSSE